jgi:lipoate-protein ligase A
VSVRVSVLADTAVSYGVGVRESAPFLASCRTEGVPALRRGSGGTGVLHARNDLVWSVVLPRSDPRVGRTFVREYRRLGAGVATYLNRRGIPADWTAPPGLATDYCALSGRGEVLSVGDRILGGAAQHVTRAALLHQGMLPLTVDRELVGRLWGIHDRSALGRLVGLRDLGINAPPAEIATELGRSIRAMAERPE